MPDSLDTRAKIVFDEAIELKGAERLSYLDRACAGDSVLLARVKALLNAAEMEDHFLSQPTTAPEPKTTVHSNAEQPGERIGPYKLLELIGEGGFGSVFMAEQSQPVRRRVALKIIKLGMDTRAVVARFEQERQALALMDHPNIAKVLDAGATDTGRPYFVMELVKGRSITTFCDAANLTISQRLELFTQVCHAVQHAHTKGVIHRDIKPSNVLVIEQDGRPFSKIIDFGIAKAIERPITDKSVFTEFRQLIGTIEYMSPEQAVGSLDIDTRTDVYSLGVLLYELLAGVTPFDPKRLRSAAIGEMQRIIREVDPPAPSTRLSQSQDTLASIAAQRRSEPRKLGATLRGELDWIVMRALDKDRARRYESPGNFAADVQRYLSGDPVQAAPPGVAYRFSKLVRRHRFGVTAAGLIALALILGLGLALWQARIASHERDAARKSASEALAAKNEADARRKETEQIAEFQAAQIKGIDASMMGKRIRDNLLADAKAAMERTGVEPGKIAERQIELANLLGAANPTNVALQALDENIFARAIKAADERFKDQPLVKTRLLLSLGETMTDLGLLEHAQAPLSDALAIRRKLLGNDHPDTLAAIDSMGMFQYAQGKLNEAEASFRQSMTGRKRVLGDKDRLTIQSISNLGSILEFQGKRSEAEPYYLEAMEKGRQFLGEDDPDTLLQMNNVGHLFQEEGKLAESEAITRQALERMRRVLHDDHPSTLFAIMNLGMILEDEGRFSEAEPLLREALERRRKVLGENHADTLRAVMALGTFLRERERYSDAEPFYREALEKRRSVLGVDHPDTLQSLNNMGALLESEKKYNEAEPFLREALERRQRVLTDAHPSTLWSMYMYANLLLTQGKPSDAEVLYRKALLGLETKYGKNHISVADCRAGLGNALRALGRFEEAEIALLEAERSLAAAEHVPPSKHQQCIKDLVSLYEAWINTSPEKGVDVKLTAWKSKLLALERKGDAGH